MDEDKKKSQNPATSQQSSSPPQPMKKKGGAKKWIILIVILLVIAGGGFLIFRGTGGQNVEPSPTPSPTNLFTPDPTETPEPVDRSEVSVQILNGTGIAGEAAYLQGQLAELEYDDIEVGNADDQDNTETQVTFSSDLSQAIIDELTEELESIYQEVDVTTTRSSGDYDVVIITGLRQGQTARPSPTATPTPSPTESPTASPEASPTGE